MAFNQGAAIVEFDTEQTAITTSSSVTDTGFSVSGDSTTVTSNAPLAQAVLSVTFSSAPDGYIALYRRAKALVSGAGDAPVPSATYKYDFLGKFILEPSASTQNILLPSIPLIASQDFYIENQSGVSIPSATVITIKPYTYNAAP